MTFGNDNMIEIQGVGEVIKKGAAAAVTDFLSTLGLRVEQGLGASSVQSVRGFQRRVGTGTWYAVNDVPDLALTPERAADIRARLNSHAATETLREWLIAEFVVKLVPSTSCPPRAFKKLLSHSAQLQKAVTSLQRWETADSSPSACPKRGSLMQRAGSIVGEVWEARCAAAAAASCPASSAGNTRRSIALPTFLGGSGKAWKATADLPWKATTADRERRAAPSRHSCTRLEDWSKQKRLSDDFDDIWNGMTEAGAQSDRGDGSREHTPAASFNRQSTVMALSTTWREARPLSAFSQGNTLETLAKEQPIGAPATQKASGAPSTRTSSSSSCSSPPLSILQMAGAALATMAPSTEKTTKDKSPQMTRLEC